MVDGIQAEVSYRKDLVGPVQTSALGRPSCRRIQQYSLVIDRIREPERLQVLTQITQGGMFCARLPDIRLYLPIAGAARGPDDHIGRSWRRLGVITPLRLIFQQ